MVIYKICKMTSGRPNWSGALSLIQKLSRRFLYNRRDNDQFSKNGRPDVVDRFFQKHYTGLKMVIFHDSSYTIVVKKPISRWLKPP